MMKQRGVTLIELLLAMGVSALLAVLAWQAVDQVVTLKTSADAHQRQQAALSRFFYRLEQDWLQVAPRSVIDAVGNPEAAVFYENGQLRFSRLSLGLTPEGTRGVMRVGYWVEEGVLVRAIWPVLDAAPDTRPHKQPLLRQVRQLNIRLYDGQKRAYGQWPAVVDTPEALTQLPVALEVTLVLEDGQRWTRWLMGVR